MTCVSRTLYLAHGESNGEISGRSRYQNHSKRVVKNMEGRNVGTIGGKRSKQDLTNADDL